MKFSHLRLGTTVLASLFLLSTSTATMYPDKSHITQVFTHLTGPSPNEKDFWSNVSPTVNWTIEGTHPGAGQYHNRTVLLGTFARISAVGKSSAPLVLSLLNVIGGGNEEWSVQELKVEGVCKNGLIFDNRYAWATRWDTQGMIVEARAYLDSALVAAALEQNEAGSLFTYSDPRDTIIPFTELSEEELAPASGPSSPE